MYFQWNRHVTTQPRVQASEGGIFFKVGGTSARQKTMEKLLYNSLNWQLWRHKRWSMTSSLLPPYFKQFYAMFYKPLTTPIYRKFCQIANNIAKTANFFLIKWITSTTDPIPNCCCLNVLKQKSKCRSPPRKTGVLVPCTLFRFFRPWCKLM